jgi:ubiquinone/menaquinone biosynthesis C-methylase UbiE
MKMNRIEKFAMNNPIRALIQRHSEAPLLERLGGRVEGLKVLEIGCGQGVGTEIIFNRFGAREIHAFDIDPEMIERAGKRLSSFIPDRLKLTVGDATSIEAESNSYDAVFDFWIIHHVPRWQDTVTEICRLLRPGGRFFFGEVTSHALNRWSYKLFLEHPKENRFSGEEFVSELERQGIKVGMNWVSRFFGDFIFGVGRMAE